MCKKLLNSLLCQSLSLHIEKKCCVPGNVYIYILNVYIKGIHEKYFQMTNWHFWT